MQTVSGSWATNVAATVRNVDYSVSMSWPLTLVTSNFFTINTSHIGGPDIIKSGGSSIAFFDQYQYTDYSSRLISMSVSQQLGQYPYGIVMAQANVQLDNSDYLFTPGFDPTIGAYILPNRPVKFSLGFDGETLQQFTGFTDQPITDRSELTMSFTACDVLNYACNYVSALTSVLTGLTADQIIAAALAEIGFSSSQYSLDASLQQPIGALAPYGQRWGDLFQYLCEAEQAMLFVDENGIVRFWNRQHFTTMTTPVWNVSTSATMENFQSETTPIFNSVVVTANPRAVAPLQLVWQMGTAIAIPAGGTYDYEVDFSDADGDLPVTTVDTPVGNAVGDSSYTCNTAADGSGADVTGSVSISGSLVGTSYFATFTNSTGAIAYLTAFQIYGTPCPVTDHISISYSDPTSIAAYGINPGNNGYVLEIDNDYIQTQDNATSLAYALVEEFKTAGQRYLAYPIANPAIQIGDLLQVTNSDTSVVTDMYVTGRTVTLGVGELTYTLELEQRTLLQYFKIGTSLIGGTDPIAP